MAENPTSSSTTYTTFGAPSGAFGGSNGSQSGTESRISTLIVPLNGLLILVLLQSTLIPRVLGPAAARRLTAEQPGLGSGEFVVGQRALLVQGGKLVQLIWHRRRRGG